MAPSGATINLGISSTSGNGNVNGSGINESGGTTGGGGARASTNMQGPLPTFNLVVESFHEL